MEWKEISSITQPEENKRYRVRGTERHLDQAFPWEATAVWTPFGWKFDEGPDPSRAEQVTEFAEMETALE